jgi:eukaryotic-like serine/threonine-protein kinase
MRVQNRPAKGPRSYECVGNCRSSRHSVLPRGRTRAQSVLSRRGVPPQDPFIGRDILNGQFQILQKIGSGGMGSVYKALQRDMNRMVAVKILHPKLANRKDLVSRFRREARAMSHLTHPNTVKVFLYGELDDGSLYIIMEFLDGKNLNQTVRGEGPMPIERALPILMQTCGALDEAHMQGIVHRDLKPENIFLCTQGGMKDSAKVLDFGLAKVTEREMRPGSLILTQEGMVFGTPEFMSPEQAQGKTLGPPSDIYSLAVILYEVLTGKLPFEAKSPMDHIQQHVTQAPIPIGERAPDRTFPPLLWPVLSRAMAKKPEDRFASAADFAEAMKLVLAGATALPPYLSGEATARIHFGATDPVRQVKTAPSTPVLVPPSAPAVRPPPPVPRQAPRQARPAPRTSMGLLVGVGLAFLIVGAALAVLVMRFIR